MLRATSVLCLIAFFILWLGIAQADEVKVQIRQHSNGSLSPTKTSAPTSNVSSQSPQTKPSVPPSTASQSTLSEHGSTLTGAPIGSLTITLPVSTSLTGFPTASSSSNTTSTGTGTGTGAASGVIILPQPTNVSSNKLPNQPQITPVFGIAGLVLILSGIPYTFIGVRGRWMHISFSVAYLSALAITVLIIYVASPPISEAVQGAYFVAIFVPACILGGLALIFPEATQGLGCLLGGFCLSMWFMIWKTGGLISAEGGRVAFILVLSVVSFSLSFTRYTRTYALMGCTAFAGSTAIILGIDCFSRAGLKEFWVFIWGLNSTLFPVGTVTYPSTHGIRAEAACIVIMTCCGVLSQTKLWKIYKRRRDRQAADRAQDEEDRRHLEGELGRQLEHDNRRERAQWEAIYGGKEHLKASVSNFGSSYAPSLDSRPTTGISTQAVLSKGTRRASIGADLNSVEMGRLPVKTNHPGSVQLHNAQSDIVTISNGVNGPQSAGRAFDDPRNHLAPVSSQPDGATPDIEHLKHRSLSPSNPPPPALVSVPFPAAPRKRFSATGSDTTPICSTIKQDLPQVEAGSSAEQGQDDQEGNIDEEDVASSVIGTWDGQADDRDSLPPLTRSPSPVTPQITIELTRKPKHRKVESASDLPNPHESPNKSSRHPKPAQRRRNSAPLPDELHIAMPESRNERAALFTDARSTIIGLQGFRGIGRISSDSINHSKSSLTTQSSSLKMQPSQSVASTSPRVTQPYWTNEWAKQLQMAEKPVLEELRPTLDGISIRHGSQDFEAAAPVNAEELQQTANHPTPSRANSIQFRQAKTQNSSSAITGPRSILVEDQISASLARNPSKPIIHVTTNGITYTNGGANSKPPSAPLQRSTSQPSLIAHSSRNLSSAVLSEALVESPIEEASEHLPSRTQSTTSQARAGSKVRGLSQVDSQRSTSRSLRLRSGSRPTSSQGQANRIFDPATNYSDFTSATRIPANTYGTGMPSFPGFIQPKINGDAFSGQIPESDGTSMLGYRQDPTSSKRFPRRQSLPDVYHQAPQQPAPAHCNQLSNVAKHENLPTPPQSLQGSPLLGQNRSSHLQNTFSQYALPNWSTSLQSAQYQTVYDSHQPRRTTSFNASANESRLADWYLSLQADAHANLSQQQQSIIDPSHFNSLYEQHRRDQQFKQRAEDEKGLRELAMDQRMRSGEMVSTHRSILRKMEAEVQARSAATK